MITCVQYCSSTVHEFLDIWIINMALGSWIVNSWVVHIFYLSCWIVDVYLCGVIVDAYLGSWIVDIYLCSRIDPDS